MRWCTPAVEVWTSLEVHLPHRTRPTAEAMLVAQADRIEFLATAFLAILNERRELCRQMIEVGQDDSGLVQQAERTARQNSEAMQKFLNATSLT
jgi:hypothetical protein